jgi:1-phosphofructokinase family hexose kinase
MILCIDTALTLRRTMTFARLALEAVNRATTVHQNACGAGIDIARVLHALGHRPLASGLLGGDSGRFISDELDRQGIAHAMVTVAASTRTCTMVVDQSTGTATELIEPPAAIPPAAWIQLAQVIEQRLGEASGMTWSGPLPPGAPPELSARCFGRARQRGIPVVVDARSQPIAQVIREHPSVIYVELADLWRTPGMEIGADAEVCGAISRLCVDEPQWILVTRDTLPTIVGDGHHFWRVTPPQAMATAGPGGGDALMAGLVAELSRGAAVPQAVLFGFACAAANMTARRPTSIGRDKIDRLLSPMYLDPI